MFLTSALIAPVPAPPGFHRACPLVDAQWAARAGPPISRAGVRSAGISNRADQGSLMTCPPIHMGVFDLIG